MANDLDDLNTHLFDAMRRLNSDTMKPDDIEAEAKRAAAVVDLADQIIEGQKLRLNAARLFAEHGRAVLPMLPRIGGGSGAGQPSTAGAIAQDRDAGE
jgi:hypothetical protein